MKYKAIIWDCDGVLIDSEVLACGAAADLLCELGYTITLNQYLERFMGKNDKQMFAEISQETGLQLAKIFPHETLLNRQKELFATSLKAIPAITETLKAIDLPMAVASGSSLARITQCLTVTQLLSHFNGHIYSVEHVKNGKPAPDVFLHAAQKLGVAPKDCLVIEDSIHGVAAAKGAGMDVFAFTGGGHITEKLRQNLVDAKPNKIFADMRALPLLLASAPEQKTGNAS